MVGVFYIDGGIGKSRDFLIEMLRFEIDKVSREGYIKDYKSALQEYTQKQKLALPIYKVVSETGPKHQKEFLVGVRVNGKVIGEGKGPTKKEGEQKAAEEALKKLQGGGQTENPIKEIFQKVKKSIWI